MLFLSSSQEDYLADSVLHGFRSLFGSDCVDYPKAEQLYQSTAEATKSQIRGNGFTLYSGLLEDIEVDRFHIVSKVKAGFFDLIVVGDIWRQYGLFCQLRPWLHSGNAVVLDGADTSAPYPAAGFWWRRPYYWLIPRAHREFLYFKREWTCETRFSIVSRFLPPKILAKIPPVSNLRPIAFGFPQEKIIAEVPQKDKDFSVHIVDTDVARQVEGTQTSYAFANEADYYQDLQRSRFGITTKRAGWDCLRHYEIAANGAVPCFRDLNQKPSSCAPHGLNGSNCISYTSAGDLFRQLEALSSEEYLILQKNSLSWILANTTVSRAQQVLAEWQKIKSMAIQAL